MEAGVGEGETLGRTTAAPIMLTTRSSISVRISFETMSLIIILEYPQTARNYW